MSKHKHFYTAKSTNCMNPDNSVHIVPSLILHKRHHMFIGNSILEAMIKEK